MRQRRRHGRVRCDDDQHTDHDNRDAVRDDAGVDRSNDDATNGAVHNPHDDDRHHDPHDELVDNPSIATTTTQPPSFTTSTTGPVFALPTTRPPEPAGFAAGGDLGAAGHRRVLDAAATAPCPAPPPGRQLPATGSSPISWTVLASLFLIGGAVLLTQRRIR